MSRWEVCTRNGNDGTPEVARWKPRPRQSDGAGEIVINSIDSDGVMKGYDLALAERVRAEVRRCP